MKDKVPEVLVFLSAPQDAARSALQDILEDSPEARVTVYLRDAQRPHLEDLLDDCKVRSDKPRGSKRAFLAELRSRFYDEVTVLDHGQWSFCSARLLFFFARGARKTVRTERGAFVFSVLRPLPTLKHIFYRAKHRSGSVAGLPPHTPMPFLIAAYRATLGRAIGVCWTIVEYAFRRLLRT